MMTEHIDEASALALVALAEDDPQRRDALLHAESCPPCSVLLEQSAELLTVIDDAEQTVPVSRALKERVERAVWGPASQRPALRYVVWSLLGLLSLLLVLLDGHFSEPLSAELGLRCLAYETGLGMLPLPVAGVLYKTGLVRAVSLDLVALSAGFALFGQLLLRTRCEAHGAGLHMLAFHVGGVVLAALIGIAAQSLVNAHIAR